MGLVDLFFTAIGLSMDAFAVSVCKGLSVSRVKSSQYLTVGFYFGGFQALMPLLGYFLGVSFRSLVESIDHWIAFVLLSIIGINMIKDSFGKDDDCCDCSFGAKAMLPLAVATSIDALAVGVTFAFLKVDILPAVSFIGVTTFVLSVVGVYLGNKFGARYNSKAKLAGGVVLVIMGIRILLEHLGVFSF